MTTTTLQTAENVFNAIEPAIFAGISAAFPEITPFIPLLQRAVAVAEGVANAATGGTSISVIVGDLVKQITPGQPNVPILGPDSPIAADFKAPQH